MKHAFCVIAYGQSPFLRSCVQSLLAQQQHESAVVITTSTPSSFIDAIGTEFMLPVIVNPQRADIATDWNFALDAVDAPLVTLAHQDDLYRPDYESRMREMFREHPELLIAFSDFEEHTPSGKRPVHLNLRIKRHLTRRVFRDAKLISSSKCKRRLLAWGNPVCCPSVVFNRARLQGFRFTRNMASNLDWEAWSRLAEADGAFGYVREPLVSKMVHIESETSASLANRRRQLEDVQMFERFWPRAVARTLAAVYRTSYLANRV